MIYVFDIEQKGTFRKKLERATKDEAAEILNVKHIGLIVALQGFSRMSISNELLYKAQRLQGIPLIDAPTSWQYFVWKLEYNAETIERQTNLADLHVTRGVQAAARDKMQWLGRVPPKALIEIRKTGAIEEIRQIIRKGVYDLTLTTPLDFQATSVRVFNNFQEAFKEHAQNIEKLSSKKWKFAKTDVASWLVVGSLAAAAAVTGEATWGLASLAADQLLDPPKLKDMPGKVKKLVSETTRMKKSPVGMLFKYAKMK